MAGELQLIEELAHDYAGARDELTGLVSKLQDEIDAAKRRHLSRIKDAYLRMADAKCALYDEIEANRDVFENPKTRIFHGIKVGFRKLRGEIGFEDEARVIKLLREKFPDACDNVIRTSESIVKTALAEWSAGDLKKLGVNVLADTDDVIIKPVEGDVEKMMKAFESDLDKEIAKKE